MLRNAEDAPAASAKFPVHFPVAFTVTGDLGLPKLFVPLRCSVALGTAMPEAAINEDRQPLPAEREIGLSRKFKMASPPSDSLFAKKLHQHSFRPLVALSSDPRHHLRPFGLGKDVGHEGQAACFRDTWEMKSPKLSMSCNCSGL
jgi:hypothetical protein